MLFMSCKQEEVWCFVIMILSAARHIVIMILLRGGKTEVKSEGWLRMQMYMAMSWLLDKMMPLKWMEDNVMYVFLIIEWNRLIAG